MSLQIITADWKDLTNVDKTTYDLAKKIEAMAEGLTPKQFCDAISIAVSFVSGYSTLSIRPVPSISKQD